ncbi:hypothetical protein AFCDBAGC_5062 [Methylobacterium cerastii]|uniref:Uncharacterized protein n=1 Tax=Methylobacterium cerastii TaxID=932741 RepID=A0ABQ4QPF0_9HYPH|nr:hypothetical protein AFCDBAGC_5062 [Methylobacterium cerastii]
MRVILTTLAIFQIRWAAADLARAERLSEEADVALARADARHCVAEGLAQRAGFGAMLGTRR